MSKKWNQSLVKEIRKKEEERQSNLPFLFLPKEGGKIKIEMIDQTFTQIFKGEEGLDGRVTDWDQPQIKVVDFSDNRQKAFKPHASLASLIWLRCEEAGENPLDMEGLVFDVTKDGYDHTVTLVKTARFVDGDKHKDDEMASEEQVREVLKKVILDNPEMGIKEISLWSLEYLKEEGLKADKKLVSKLIAEEKE